MGLLGPMEGQSCNAWSVTVSYCSSGGKSSPLGSPSHPPTHLGIARPSFALLNLPWSCPLVNCLTFDGENTTESARPCMQNCLQYLNGILFLWNFASTLHTIDLRRRENPKNRRCLLDPARGICSIPAQLLCLHANPQWITNFPRRTSRIVTNLVRPCTILILDGNLLFAHEGSLRWPRTKPARPCLCPRNSPEEIPAWSPCKICREIPDQSCRELQRNPER